MKKTLIIYSGHEVNDNLDYFIKNGYIDDPMYDFVFIFNNLNQRFEFLTEKKNVRIMTRENIGLDFGGWTHVLFSKDPDNDKYLYEKYDYFIFLNQTVRGPFLPLWYQQKKHGFWPELFISNLNDDVKLVGTCVGFFASRPYISSVFLVMDRIGLDIAINKKIFDLTTICMPKSLIITKKEIGLSSAIIEAGYNIRSMLYYYKDIDFRKYKSEQAYNCHLRPNKYFDININPYEIIFIKQNRSIDPLLLDRYTEWHNK